MMASNPCGPGVKPTDDEFLAEIEPILSPRGAAFSQARNRKPLFSGTFQQTLNSASIHSGSLIRVVLILRDTRSFRRHGAQKTKKKEKPVSAG
jgi:hypothetical protein